MCVFDPRVHAALQARVELGGGQLYSLSTAASTLVAAAGHGLMLFDARCVYMHLSLSLSLSFSLSFFLSLSNTTPLILMYLYQYHHHAQIHECASGESGIPSQDAAAYR